VDFPSPSPLRHWYCFFFLLSVASGLWSIVVFLWLAVHMGLFSLLRFFLGLAPCLHWEGRIPRPPPLRTSYSPPFYTERLFLTTFFPRFQTPRHLSFAVSKSLSLPSLPVQKTDSGEQCDLFFLATVSHAPFI